MFFSSTKLVLRLAPDERLVELVRAGSEAAFETVYDRHHRGILTFCRHMLGSAEEAEDAVQHVFLAAYRSLVADRGREMHLRAWLYTIARNRCLSILRARRERPLDEVAEPSTEHLADEVQRREDLRTMLRDVARLPDDQRAALVLAEVGDVSHEDIAEVLGVRREKVKALVFQARSSLAASRVAREVSCSDVREQLAELRGGALRRTSLRRHLRDCAGCREFRAAMLAQRRALAVLLPVVPTAGLKAAVMGSAFGGSAAAGGAATGAAGGGAAAGASGGGAAVTGAAAPSIGGAGLAAKALVVVAVAGSGAAVGTHELSSAPAPAPAQRHAAPARPATAHERPAERVKETGAATAPGRVKAPGTSARPGRSAEHRADTSTGGGRVHRRHEGDANPAAKGHGLAKGHDDNAGGNGNGAANGNGNGNGAAGPAGRANGNGDAKGNGAGNAGATRRGNGIAKGNRAGGTPVAKPGNGNPAAKGGNETAASRGIVRRAAGGSGNARSPVVVRPTMGGGGNVTVKVTDGVHAGGTKLDSVTSPSAPAAGGAAPPSPATAAPGASHRPAPAAG